MRQISKKIIVMGLLAMLAFSVIGCGKKDNQVDSGTESVAPENAYLVMEGSGGGWAPCVFTLLQDGSYTVDMDYGKAFSGTMDSGTYEVADDGSITFTSSGDTKYDATATCDKDGNYTFSFEDKYAGTTEVTGQLVK